MTAGASGRHPLPGLSECLRGERQLSEVVTVWRDGTLPAAGGHGAQNPELMQSDACRNT
jgi:hypothetical protein